MQQRGFNLAGIFSNSFGKEVGEALRTHDWSSVTSSLAGSLGNSLSQMLGGLGGFGGFFGGIFSGLIGSIGGGGGFLGLGASKADPTESTYKVKAFVTNWPSQLTADLSLMPVMSLRGASTTININAGTQSPARVAQAIRTELAAS